MKRLLVILLVLGVTGWWFSPHSPRQVRAPAGVATPAGCPLPAIVRSGEPPLQSRPPPGMQPFVLAAGTLVPLAGFSVEARVLSRQDYAFGREADFSPTDLALGWQRMADDDVLARLSLSQGGRFFSYRWREQPPLPPDELQRSASNMHMIPANDDVADALSRIGRDDRVRIDGWLVEAVAEDGWRWRSSLSRSDSGAGACELVYVCAIRRL